jgi:hypothetical protein
VGVSVAIEGISLELFWVEISANLHGSPSVLATLF